MRDSSAVIGSDRAAELPARLKGRAWIAHGSSSAELVQFALATPHDILAVAERWTAEYSPRRPWCEPLAEQIPLAAVAELSVERRNSAVPLGDQRVPIAPNVGGVRDDYNSVPVCFGLTDLPAEQRQGLAEWSPSGDGNVLILGAPGSGKSMTIATITTATLMAASARSVTFAPISAVTHAPMGAEAKLTVVRGGLEPAGFWDTLSALHAELDRIEADPHQSRYTLLTIDDLDAVVSRYEDDYRVAVLDKLARLLREGPAQHIWVVASAQRITPALQSLAQLIPNILRLRFGNRQEFVLAGGISADYTSSLPPGGGHWKGARVQIALSDSYPPAPQPALVTTLQRTENLVIASSRPASATAALTAAGWQIRTLEGAPGAERELLITDTNRPVALIGSIDEWQSRWGALALLRPQATILLDGCSLSDYRQLARTRELPPPLAAGSGHYWRVNEDGTDRVRLLT